MTASRKNRRKAPRTPMLLAPALVAISAASYAAAPVEMSSEPVKFDIAAQSLESALAAYGDQAEVQILVPSKLVAGMRTHGVSGEHSRKEALSQLLDRSGLTYELTGNHTVRVLRLAQAEAPPATAAPAVREAAEASAEPALEEIVVTAQKREERLQDIPIAITAITSADLEKRGVTTFGGVASSTPSIVVAPSFNSANTLIIYMRGQGVNDPGLNTEGGVGIYADGFYLARANATTFDLADIERVEVLRGPQGTLYGRNTTGGAVNIISKKPSGELGLKETLTFGNRNLVRSLTTLDLPAWHDISTKVSVLKSSIDGYVENLGDSHDFGESQQQAGRVQLHWDGVPGVAVDYFGEAGEIQDTQLYTQNKYLNGMTLYGYEYYANPDGPNDRSYRPFDIPLNKTKFSGHGLTLSWQVADGLTIKSLTGYRELQADGYGTQSEAVTYWYPPYGLQALTIDTYSRLRHRQLSQELQLVGDLFDKQIDYVAGLYYFDEQGRFFQNQIFNGDPKYMELTQDAVSKAAFGQVTYSPEQFDRKLQLTLGLRYNVDERGLERYSIDSGVLREDHGTADASKTFNKFNPSFTVNYHWTGDLSTYAKVSTAYRAGGFRSTAPIGMFNESAFDPENVTNYEVGLKSEWLDRRLRLNGAAFSSKLDDMQVNYNIDQTRPGDALVINAGSATINGAELEVRYLATASLELGLDYSYLDAKIDRIDVLPGSVFDSAVNPASTYPAGSNMAALFNVPRTPEHSFSVSADNSFGQWLGGEVSLHLDYRWQDEYLANQNSTPAYPNHEISKTPAYGLLNARLSSVWRSGNGVRTTVSLWGNNVLDEKYLLNSAVFRYGPVPGNGGNHSSMDIWAEPATYGITLSCEF
jgi:iron complex outermembrane receptor protein